ncbi:DotU family type IV/VI secretion system protein [Variovorax paradoxus]|uniref:DotU family type IV/VI secretion system protein n=1 Tax=Variovorax paradoxus TaxID=34073 RepID=UPI00277D9A93|nr:DotU family type IV/VI secretion system protein [Variovorax paradoxus]MDQ0589002.1 type IV/VI secretion system ImpK/VasF family protein [Variovorax paradoxus]
MVRLLDCFSAFVSFGLALDASIATGRAAPASHGAARQQARRLLDAARASASGKPAAQIESAAFAMVAWIDEILARHPGAGVGAVPLQVELFNSNNAHSEFFHHLSALTAEDDELREVYWHALVHGFKGQYYFESDDRGELGKLKELHGRQLRLRPMALGSLVQNRITPQPYGVADPPGPHDVRRRDRALLRAIGMLALLLPLLYFLSWQWFAGPHAGEPEPAQRIEQHLQSYACADLSASASKEGRLHVSGFVSLPADVERVGHEVAGLPNVGSPTFDVRLRVWPHCEVFAILKPYQLRNREKAYGLGVMAVTASDGRLREGDDVRVQVAAPRHDSYLWVDYYTADGSVMHLNTGQAPARLRAGEKLELGRDIPSSWLVAPPFGTVLVTVLSSPAPFDGTADRPPYELASAYLLRLREALATNRGAERLLADFEFLETTAR